MKNGKKLFSILLCIALIAGNFVSAGFVSAEDVAPGGQPEQPEQQAQDDESAEQDAEQQEVGENQEAQSQELSQQNEPSEQQSEDVEQVNPQGGQNNSTDDENDKDVEPGTEGEVQENVEAGAEGEDEQIVELGTEGEVKQDVEPKTEDEVKQNVEAGAEDEVQENVEPGTEGEVQENFEAGTLTIEENEYSVTLTYGADAKIPSDATLSVQEISNKTAEYEKYLAEAATKVFEEEDTDATTLPYARFFDITILDAEGETVEPAAPVQVTIDLKDQILATEDVEFAAVHFVEEENEASSETTIVETELVEIETGAAVDAVDEESAVSFDADSFSVYGVLCYYTVDFFYGGVEYHMNGGSEMMMSELFTKLGIERSAADIASVEFTDDTLVTFTQEGDDWRITSLEPFSTSETLTITFKDGEVIVLTVKDDKNRTPEGNINWNLDNNGTLTIRPSNSATSAQFNNSRNSQDAWNSYWAYPNGSSTYIRSEVKKIIIKPNGSGVPINLNSKQIGYMFAGFSNLETVEIQEGAFTGSATSIASMFRDCTKLKEIKGLEYLDTTNVQDMSSMFNNTGSATTGFSLDLSAWKNDGKLYNMQNMFANSGVVEVTLNNEDFKTRPYANGGCQFGAMFFNAKKLKKIDLSNITMTGRPADTSTATGHNANQEAGGILSTGRNGNATLETVIMNNTKFVDMAAFNGMFSNCPKLTTVEMKSASPGDMAPDAVNMSYMFANSFTSPSGSGTPTLDVSGFGKLDNIVNMEGFVENCTGLKILNIDNLDNSRIEPTQSKHPAWDEPYKDQGAIDLNVDWSRMLALHTCTALETISAKDSNVWIVENNKGTPSKEYFLAENDAAVYKFTEKQFTFASDVGPTVEIETKRDYVDLVTDRHETGSRGIDNHAESYTNKNMTGGSHLNTNGAGHLAPGVYTISTDNRGETNPEAKLTYYRITEMGKVETTRTVEIVNNLGGVLEADGTYGVATSEQNRNFWGTEKELGNGNDVLIRITYTGAATDINGVKHDVIVEIKKITFKDGNLIPNFSSYNRRSHDTNKVAGEKYSRKILEAQSDKLKLNNYVYSTNWSNGTTTGSSNEKVLSQGSGTYIDFDIRVKDAVDGSSVLFYVDDLDVPHQQNWGLPEDACFDDLTWENVGYGEGSEGIVLGTGNDIDTLSFADHTGLQLLNRNYVVGTGTDPSTSWSEFYVRANAKGSSYTWTSGIGCDTDLLKNTEPVPAPKPVWVFPEAIKYVNSTIPSNAYDEYFEFTFDAAAAGENGANYKYNDLQRNVKDLPNSATSAAQNLKNKKEHISISELEFPVPTNNVPVKYIYEIKEKEGEGSGDILNYDTATKHYMQVVVFRPTNDIEMYQGTRAEIILGTKRGDGEVVWNTDDVYAVYSTNAQLVAVGDGPNGEDIYVDAQGIKFYRIDDKYYRHGDNTEMAPTTHAKIDRKVTYSGQEYQVKVDKNGVEYFQDADGKYRDPNHADRELVTARTGDIDEDTVKYDSPLAVEKKVNGQTVREDVHGIQYYGTYNDTNGEPLTVKDGTFNPDANDKIVYESAKSSTGETIYVHANGQKYFVKSGKYYDADDESKELAKKTTGDIDPLPSDKNAKGNEVQTKEVKETFSGKGYTVRLEPTHNIEYYKDDTGNYYTRYGTMLQLSSSFAPSGSDPTVTVSREIWEDGSGIRFYKNEGQYYKEADDTRMTKLSNGTLDTSEVVEMGSFNNTTNVSDITINKTTVDNKSGKFTVHVKFDNGFEPRYVVYEPASTATFEKVDGTEDTWAFTIEDGQRLTIKDVPLYTTYTITEPVEANGWELVSIDGDASKTSISKEITSKTPDGAEYNTAYKHTFQNRFTEVLLNKKVSLGDKTEKFTFTVKATVQGNPDDQFSYGWMDEANNQHFEVATIPAAGKITVTISDLGSFPKLADGEDVVIVVPFGATIQITESGNDYDTTFDAAGTSGTGKDVNVNVDADKKKVTFTNDKNTAKLIKVWDDDSDAKGFRPDTLVGSITYKDGDTETTLDTDTYGGDWVKDGNTWTYTFRIPKGAVLTGGAEEDVPLGYTHDESTDVLDAVSDPQTYTITNVLKETEETVSLKRTITYVYEDTGEPVLDENGDPIVVEQELEFTREVKTWDPVTGEPSEWYDWVPKTTAAMAAATSPKADREGFEPDEETVPATDALTGDDKELKDDKYPDVTVVYRKGPDAGDKKTYGGKGETQKGTLPFTEGSSPIESYTLIDPETGDPTDTVTIDGEGTYTIDPKTGEVTFVPEDDFTGEATTVTVRATDKNGKTADGTYTPHVVDNEETKTVGRTIKYQYSDGTPVANGEYDKEEAVTFVRTGTVDPKTGEVTFPESWEVLEGDENLEAVDSPEVDGWTPDKEKVDAVTLKPTDSDIEEVVTYNPEGITAEPDISYGLAGRTQKGKVSFKSGTSKLPDGSENKLTLKLRDPATNELVDEVTIPGQGTYKLSQDGTVEFTPEDGFVGTPDPIIVTATDMLGKVAVTTYTPHVVDPTDSRVVKRVIKYRYDSKTGEGVIEEDIVQEKTMIRHAAEVDAKTGSVLAWGPWEPVTFPAVPNPDSEAKEGYSTKDIAGELTITDPYTEVEDAYVIYVKVDPVEPDKPVAPGADTGDRNNIALWITLFVVTLLLAVAVWARSKVRRKN
ncbi:MAG: BspA family leucine-rich repeat surface protein [Firmicutes bacterium]|nr:BspA family leucine-rich repeat surface protein [Bacillota bacterium]